MFFIPRLRENKMIPKVKKEQEFYSNMETEEIINFQIEKFNSLWQVIQRNVPYYKELVFEKKLPSSIESWDDFSVLPITGRVFARENIDMLSDISRQPDHWVTTGGSTGNPLKYPSWKEESLNYETNIWYARSFYNIKRSDKMFRMWGHSHTLGNGLSKYKKIIALKIGLPLIGYKRFSAYDLSESMLKKAGEEILKFKPNYIIGYSKSIQMLAKANEDKKDKLRKLKLKAVFGAAEGFENDQDKQFIEKVFGCPVGLEYASMETKLLAHTHPDGDYKIIWKNNLVECVDEKGNPASEGRILITSLYPRAFPLIRYELGDIISETKKSGHSVYSFGRVKGRDNDFLMLDDDTPIHSESITHAIKFSDNVSAYQIRYTKELKYTIYLNSNKNISKSEIDAIKNRLGKIDKRLATLDILVVDTLKQTIAGKVKWLMEE